MTIPTQLSLNGFIATAPELTFTDKGHARVFRRVGIEQHRKEVDGSFTKLDLVYCDLVMFDRTAERAYPRFKPGDQVVASGAGAAAARAVRGRRVPRRRQPRPRTPTWTPPGRARPACGQRRDV